MEFQIHLPLNELVDSGQSAAVMLITDLESIALIRRQKRDDDPWSGQIALPGGMKKHGETLQETAIRETKEEVGFLTIPQGYIGSFRTHVREIVVAAFYTSVQEEPRFSIGNEVEEVNWVRINSFTPTITDAGFPGYKFYGGVVWGLTYRILQECLKEIH